jgi:hypothetical protein
VRREADAGVRSRRRRRLALAHAPPEGSWNFLLQERTATAVLCGGVLAAAARSGRSAYVYAVHLNMDIVDNFGADTAAM